MMKFSFLNTRDGVEQVVTMEMQEVAGSTLMRGMQDGNPTDAVGEA